MRKPRKDPGEEIAVTLLKNLGLSVEKYPEQDIRTPDFRVSSSDGFYFLTEVKTIVGPGDDQALIWQTLHNRISAEIYDASEQFNSVNVHRLAANVLIFVSQDMRIDGRALLDFFKGEIKITDDIIVDLSRQRKGKAGKRIHQIDLFIVISHAGTPTFFYTQTDNRFRQNLERIFSPIQARGLWKKE